MKRLRRVQFVCWGVCFGVFVCLYFATLFMPHIVYTHTKLNYIVQGISALGNVFIIPFVVYNIVFVRKNNITEIVIPNKRTGLMLNIDLGVLLLFVVLVFVSIRTINNAVENGIVPDNTILNMNSSRLRAWVSINLLFSWFWFFTVRWGLPKED